MNKLKGSAGGRALEIFRCEDLRARLTRKTCATQYVARASICARCKSGLGKEHAIEFGLVKAPKRKDPEHKIHTKACVRCGVKFQTSDGRAYHCPDCQTPKARIKSASERAQNVLRLAGCSVEMDMTPNGAVLVYSGKPERTEEALQLLAECGYAVRVTQFSSGSAIHVIDAIHRIPDQVVKLAIAEQRMRRRAPPRRLDSEVEQCEMFDD